MDNQPWLDRLRKELARRRLPHAYAERLLRELSDHFHDLTEEKMSTEAQVACVGQPEQVAEAAVRCRRPFLRRHRWLRAAAFVVLPVPLLVLSWVLVMAAMAWTVEAIGAEEGLREYAHGLTWLQDKLAHLICSATVMVPAALLATAYCTLAKYSGNRPRWGVAAGMLLAVFAGMVTHQLTFSDIPGKFTIMFGVGFPPTLGTWQLLQFALPLLAVCLGTTLRRSESQPKFAP